MVSKDEVRDYMALLTLSIVVGIATWAWLEGHLTASLATDLLEIAADALDELAD